MTSRLVAGLLVMMSLAPLRVARCEPPPDPPSALRPGTVLGSENWEAAKGLLPEEFLEAYRKGDLRHEIGSWEPPKLGEEPTFAAALKENEDRFDLDDEGSIIDRRTGKAARDITAWPFPKIDRADPKVALKIVWNYFYTLYYGGNGHYRADLAWISRHGLDRSISVDAFHKYYEGQHPRFRYPDDHKDLLAQTLAHVLWPADVEGILSLSWRYRDAHARDSVWTYVPSLRRTRQVSPANRSDGFLGSDLSQDDGPYFDGKVQDFEWKLIGEQDLLVLFDRPSFEQKAQLTRLPEGGWRMVVPGGARVGFQVPDWKGKLLNSYVAIRTNIIPVAPGELWGWAGGAVALAVNWKLDRATTAGIVVGTDVPADSRIPLDADLFSLQEIQSRGK